jgi:hypothetical protein
MVSDDTRRFASPPAYKIASILVALAAIVQLLLAGLLIESDVRLAHSFSFLVLGTLSFALAVRLSWARWLALGAALLYLPIWVFALSASEGSSVTDKALDAVRFGGTTLAAALLWLPSVREWYKGLRSAA